jgi:EAL and modified HD-GYP domain-containing signal transduction protein
LNSNLVSSLASSLSLTPEEVNKAHLSALAWTQNITT